MHVALDTPPQQFAIDQEAEVSIATGEQTGIVVPLTALTKDRAGQPGVLVVEDGRTHFRAVTASGADDALVRVTAGLAEGETVVSNATGVRTNQSVRLAQPR